MKGFEIMPDNKEKKSFEIPRPVFPKKAVVTGGMPYGNKELHFGHVGGDAGFCRHLCSFPP